MAITASITLLYLLFLLYSIYRWQVLPIWKMKVRELSVSVLIAARNEEVHLPALLQSLEIQKYPKDKLEILVVDDHSEDTTLQLLKEWQARSRWKVQILNSPEITLTPKKTALLWGMDHAQGDILLFTDADCQMGEFWVSSICAPFSQEQIELVFGPIKYSAKEPLHKRPFLEQMLSIEQAALLGSAVGTLGLGIPTMCNGANMAIRRRSYNALGGFATNRPSASGDDELLMHKVFSKNRKGVAFVKDEAAIVETSPVKNMAEMFQQRNRWAGKWEKYLLFRTKAFALFIFLFHLSWLYVLAATLFIEETRRLFCLLFLLKVVLEAILIGVVSSFLSKKVNWAAFGLLQVVFSFYVVFFGLVSRNRNFSWKGRILR